MSGLSNPREALRDRIEAELTSPLRALGLDLEAVDVTPVGKHRLLRIAVDMDGGVTLDTVAETTKLVSETLDASDVMGEQPYTLEVTSRGVDRPLNLPRHWRRNADRLVRVVLCEGGEATGRILSSTEDSVILDVDGQHREIDYGAMSKALVQVEFNRRTEEKDV